MLSLDLLQGTEVWVCKRVKAGVLVEREGSGWKRVRVRVSVRAWLRVCASGIAMGPGRAAGRAGRSPPPTTLRNLSESPSGSAY